MPFKSGSDCRAENSGLLLKQAAVAAAALKAEASAKASVSLATERKLTAAVGSKAAEELKAAADAALMPFKSGSDCRAENSGLLLKQVAVVAAALKAEASASRRKQGC